MKYWVCIVMMMSTAMADIQSSSSASRINTAQKYINVAEAKPAQVSGPAVSAPTMRNAATAHITTAPPDKNNPAPKIQPRFNNVSTGAYPWRQNIVATVFWVGEAASARNNVPNDKSSWDGNWQANYGGYDDPNPENRTEDFRPKAFIPKQNPFYVALPYNDVSGGMHKPEASKMIPWFRRDYERPGRSVCKGKWVQIIYKNRSCFAQWEDCGPVTTEDWQFVFGDSVPQNKTFNKGAAIDISPAIRDYLGIPGGHAIVHWRFVEFHRIPRGPWSKYGDNNPFVHPELNPIVKAQKAKLQRLKELRQQMINKSGKAS